MAQTRVNIRRIIHTVGLVVVTLIGLLSLEVRPVQADTETATSTTTPTPTATPCPKIPVLLTPPLPSTSHYAVGRLQDVTHTVSRGELLWCIAQQYKTTAQALALANGIHPNGIWATSVLTIPYTSVTPVQLERIGSWLGPTSGVGKLRIEYPRSLQLQDQRPFVDVRIYVPITTTVLLPLEVGGGTITDTQGVALRSMEMPSGGSERGVYEAWIVISENVLVRLYGEPLCEKAGCLEEIRTVSMYEPGGSTDWETQIKVPEEPGKKQTLRIDIDAYPTPGQRGSWTWKGFIDFVIPTLTPTLTPTLVPPTPTATSTPTPTDISTPTPTDTSMPTPTSVTPTTTPPTPTPTDTSTPTPTGTPAVTPTGTSTPTPAVGPGKEKEQPGSMILLCGGLAVVVLALVVIAVKYLPRLFAGRAGEEREFLDVEVHIQQLRDEGYPVRITLGGQEEQPLGYLRSDLVSWMRNVDQSKYGDQLFEALQDDNDLQNAWHIAVGKSSRRRIRLWIDEKAPQLHTLSWELLRERGVMLSANAKTPFSRYLSVPEPRGDKIPERPIRVLAIISDPTDLEEKYRLPRLDVDVERSVLEAALDGHARTDVDLEFLEPPVTLGRLEDKLKLREGYHVLHYVGHGYIGKEGATVLYLQREAGTTQPVTDGDLTGMLRRQGTLPRLVYLAACHSATRSPTDAFLGLGPRLVRAGVPAVVAMQGSVTVKTARELTADFYRRLLRDGIVDLAMNEARSTLLTIEQEDAAVPVLFMRLKDGRLW
jgi:LysM repeat protein